MNSIREWLASPLGNAVLGYVLIALCTYLFKKRTPEEYAASAARSPVWFFSRWTPFWQLMGTWGPDPSKAAEALGKVITGRVQPLAIGIVAAKEDTPKATRIDPTRNTAVVIIEDTEEDAASKKDDSEAGPYRDGFLPIVVCLIGALSLLGIAPVLAACSSPGPATPEQTRAQKEHAADASYTADMMRCTSLSLYPTFEDSKACTAATRARWGRLPDGGADPAFAKDGGL